MKYAQKTIDFARQRSILAAVERDECFRYEG
jgi:hypothetical protein